MDENNRYDSEYNHIDNTVKDHADIQHDEPIVKSFTPTPEYGITPPYEYKNHKEDTNQKNKIKNKSVSVGSIVAIAVICAILSSVITSIVFLTAGRISVKNIKSNTSSSSNNQSSDGVTINVESESSTLIEAIAEKDLPSIVGIRTTTSVTYMFYGTQEETGEGSGIIYTSDGYIITNYHVISNAVENEGKIEVFLSDDLDNGVSASVIGYDVSADLAVIKIEKTGLQPIEIGDSDNLKVGATVVALGNPGGLEYYGSVSSGIISGLNRTIQIEKSGEYVNLIQTDAAINPGNSGGALVNSNGYLIGINSVKLNSSSYEGMGFAIPSNTVVSICDRIIKKVDEPQCYVGIDISSYYTSDRLNMLGYPSGVVVEAVADNSPAADAGLKRGDIITAINGVEIDSSVLYNSEKNKYDPGETIELTIYRSKQTYQVKIVLGTANN